MSFNTINTEFDCQDESYILNEIKIGEANRDPIIRERQTNFYKRLWHYTMRDKNYTFRYDTESRFTFITRYQSENILSNAILFKYMISKSKLTYVPIEELYNESKRQRENKSNFSDNDLLRKGKRNMINRYDNDDVSYNTMIRDDRMKSSNDYYNERDKLRPMREGTGEFGIIKPFNSNEVRRAEYSPYRNSHYKSYGNNDYNSYDINQNRSGMQNGYDAYNYQDRQREKSRNVYPKTNDMYQYKDDNQDHYNYYQNDHHSSYDNRNIAYGDTNPDDPKEEFGKCQNSWNRLYDSMKNVTNYNEIDNYNLESKGNFGDQDDNDYPYLGSLSLSQPYEPICIHCNTKETSLWRRLEGKTVCNACGLYFKMHGVKRPMTLKRPNLKKRNRKVKKKPEDINEKNENDEETI